MIYPAGGKLDSTCRIAYGLGFPLSWGIIGVLLIYTFMSLRSVDEVL